jgi:hypothetical protein
LSDTDNGQGVRRKARSFSKHLPPAKVYLDDLEKIYQTLKEAGQHVEIETVSETFDTPQLLADHRGDETLRELRIEGSRSGTDEVGYFSASIHLHGWRTDIRTYSQDLLAARGLLTELHEILKGRTRTQLVRFGLAALLGIFLGFTNWLAWQNALNAGWPPDDLIALAVLIVFASIFFALLGGYFIPSIYSRLPVIVLTRKAAAPGFLKRNRDQLLVGFIILVIGFLLGRFAA